MEEREALKRLKHREEDALAWFIDRYTAYVSTIVSNILGPAAASADLEAISSDVFFAFWTHAKEIRPGKAKAYLGSIARNKAKESTRKTGRELPLEDDMLVISSGTPERELEKRLVQKGTLPADAADAVSPCASRSARSFCATTIFISRSPRLRRRWGWSPQMSRRSSSGAGRS